VRKFAESGQEKQLKLYTYSCEMWKLTYNRTQYETV
jgi:hypothetical protein